MSLLKRLLPKKSTVEERRRKLQLKMMLAGGSLIILSVGFGTWALVVGTVFLAAPLGALLFTLLFREPPDGKLACSFCDREHTAVNFLIAAPRASICDACTGLTVATLYLRAAPPASSQAETLVESLARAAPAEQSERVLRILEAARALARLPRERQTLADHAIGVAQPAIAVAALEDIAAADRSINQENLRAVALSRLGRHDEALVVTEQLTTRADQPGTAGLLLNNRTWYELQSGVSDFGRLRAQCEEAIRRVESAVEFPQEWRRSILGHCMGTLASVLVRLGRGNPRGDGSEGKPGDAIDETIERLELHERAGGELSLRGLLMLGDAYAARDRGDDARRTWQRILDRATPCDEEARDARSRLGI